MSVTTWPARRVRETFVEFFKGKAHTFIQSSPVVPRKDPTLLFTNAGMNQFKEIFLGTIDPTHSFAQLKRVANSQLCIRAGGKHNDLEDVGRDTYHHTFFEMLGSWSFGDYFKKDAIDWAWELLTEVYGLEKDRLYVTYFEGNPALGLEPDLETKELWKRFVPEDRILKGNMKDNFWEMGDTGPCGPCTEIHYDRIGGRNVAHLVNKDDPMVLEIWNLVFMQYNREESRGLVKLPKPSVDTGMGLERLVSILQGVKDNYQTDLWSPIFAEIHRVTKYKHPEEYRGPDANADAIAAYRVIADHIRCLTVALADGAMPDNVGRGFVLRRIIRRAVRFGVQFLGAETGFFHQLVDVVVSVLGTSFPHLADPRTIARIKAILLDEEKSFARTWQIGLKHFQNAKESAQKSSSTEISAKDAFVLHDRYGFPVDLTRLLAEKENMTVDIEGFKKEMKTNQTSGGRVAAVKTFLETTDVDVLQKKGTPATVDNAKYEWDTSSGTILAIFDKKGAQYVDSVSGTDAEEATVGIILDSTSFYAEGGGQIYDTGSLAAKDGTFTVLQVYTYGGYICHIGRIAEGTLKVGDKVTLDVNYERRLPIAVNHTTTHELNHALRDVLQFGNPDAFVEVNQRGSLVTDDYLRFDFSWNSQLTLEQLQAVEAKLSAVIEANAPVYSKLVPLKDAMSIKSLRCMFDEKYPDPVTVVSIGKPVEELLADPDNESVNNKFSLELCGGTHIKSFGQVQRAVVVREDSTMKGVRRMVVFTRQPAVDCIAEAAGYEQEFAKTQAGFQMTELDDKLKALSVLLKKVNDSTIPLTRKMILRENIEKEGALTNKQKKEVAAEAKVKATQLGQAYAKSVTGDAPFNLCVFRVDDFGADREALTTISESFLEGHPNFGVCLIGADVPKDKALVLTVMGEAVVKAGGSAVTWAQKVCGKAGGKPNLAQGGIAASKASEAEAAAKAEAGEITKGLK